MATLHVNNTNISDVITAANQSGLYVNIQYDPRLSEPKLKIMNTSDEFAGPKYIAAAIKTIPQIHVAVYVTVEFPAGDNDFHDHIFSVGQTLSQRGTLVHMTPSLTDRYVLTDSAGGKYYGRETIIGFFNDA